MTSTSQEQPEPRGGLATLAYRARQAIGDMRERFALRRELQECDAQGELDITLDEMGLSRAQLEPLIQGHPQASRLLSRMARWVGVDLAAIHDPTIRRELQRVCSVCPTKRRCRRWLRAPEGRGYRDFCPNAALLDDLRPR